MNPYYIDYSEYMNRFFPDFKVQKISINSGGTCPNRDGTIGTGGCIYCNNTSFTPAYCFGREDITQQLEAGINFFRKKYPDSRYLAYFQSYTNTYGRETAELEKLYREALAVEKVVGLIIGTRPDCLSEETTSMLADINKEKPVFVELGVETLRDETLRIINRGHDAATALNTIQKLAEAGLHTGVHLIAGLPGETLEDALSTVTEICRHPVESIKLHHLQVLEGTELHRRLKEGKIDIGTFSPETYLDFCEEVVRIADRKICLERFLSSAPPAMVVSPKWGLKNYEFTNLLLNRLKSHAEK